MIRVAFRYGDSRWFARTVCFLRGGDSAHCEVAHGWDGLVHDCVSASWLDGGVRGKLLRLSPDKWRVYEVPGNPDDVRAWLKEHDGAGYDWPAFLGFTLLRRLKGIGRWFFCVEVAAELMWLRAPHRFDLFDLETLCLYLCKAGIARRVQ